MNAYGPIARWLEPQRMLHHSLWYIGVKLYSHWKSSPISSVTLTAEMTNEKKHRLRLQELKVLDDKRLQAQQQIKLYQARIIRAFNKKVKERTFKKGDLVLAVRRPMVMTHKTKGKFQPKWEGPFVVESVYSN